DLRALGRMKEAKQAFRASLEFESQLGDREQAFIAATQLSQIALDCGELEQALAFAERGYQLCEPIANPPICSGDFWRTASRVLQANALFQLGQRDRCEAVCREIEQMGFAVDVGDKVDHALIAFRWCDLCLGRIVSPCSPFPGTAGLDAVSRVWEEIDS